MASTKTTSTKSKPEQIIVRPGMRPVKVDATLTRGNKKPSAVMTGAGKVKSASGTKETMLKGSRTGSGSVYEDAGDVSSPSRSMRGAALGTKVGMAKSAKMAKPKLATESKSPTSRARPNAKLEARTASPRAKKSGVAQAENPVGAPAKGKTKSRS